MSKRRRDITAHELEALHRRLEKMLERAGLETMPQVAVRLLELSANPDAQVRDYAEAVKTDWALTGRILRLANSAFFSQRQPVTRLDRALIVLGIERTKAICLGFYLSRSASLSGVRETSRKVWGQSIYRASLCAALAKVQCPGLVPEAFIVGLMLDCGQPLMVRLMGAEYEGMLRANPSPSKLYAAEFDHLPYTHVDAVTVLARRWKFPPMLARPIAWHHTLPPVGNTTDPVVVLQRLAYYVGAIQLDEASNQPSHKAPLTTIADKLFEIGPSELEGVVRAANREYAQTSTLFSDVGEPMGDVEAVADAVQSQLVEIMDEQLERTVRAESRGGPERLRICGTDIEVEPARDGEVIAYISSADGERLVSCTVNPNKETPESVGRLLGLEEATPGDLFELMRVIQGMAA